MIGTPWLARTRAWLYSHRYDVGGVVALVVLAAAFLSPAVKDGGSFGGFDFDSSLTPLTAGLYGSIHSPFNGDAVSQMISWNALDWRFVHHGQFPLWNPYSVLGMPQFFNFESSVLSLPDLVSYLAPVRLAFLVAVFVKLVLAGVGVYFLCRVLRLLPVAALFGAVTFMFAGAFVNWVTWPLSDVVAWSGWVCAFAILAYRSARPRRYVALLAAAVAFSIYGGFPEANVMVAMALGVAAGGGAAALLVERVRISWRGAGRAATGAACGVLLAAPLWFPGLQVIAVAHREQEGHYAGLPLRSLPLVFTQGYFGLPVGSLAHSFQLRSWNYYETVAYVGLIAVALVAVAVLGAWRRPVVVALVLAVLFSFAATYEPVGFHPFQSVVDAIPQLSAVRFERMRSVTAFLLAVLAAVGCDVVATRAADRAVRRILVAAAGLATLAVVGVAIVSDRDHLVGAAATQRWASLVWPVALAAVLCAVAIAVIVWPTAARRRAAVGVLVVGQTAFLFAAGVAIPSYSKPFYAATPALTRLEQTVGGALVGLDGGNTSNVRSFAHVGLYPNMNLGYSVRLFGVHDPLFPTAYLASWPFPSAAPQRFGVGLFVPDINSVALARRYGIAYVIAAPGLPRPAGMVEVAIVGGEPLYRVPGAAQFSFVGSASGRVVSTMGNGDGRYVVTVDASREGELVARVTALAGWTAAIDGKPVALRTYDSVMEELTVPAGHHVIELDYWPGRLSVGLALAASAGGLLLCLLLAGPLSAAFARRRRGGIRDGTAPTEAPPPL